jgi:DNA primase
MNIIEYLEEEVGIKTTLDGKNVSTGWIGIQCPFCDDTSNHMGIRLSDLRCKCWKCGNHSFIALIKELTDCSHKEAIRLQKVLVEESDADGLSGPNPPIDSKYYLTRSSTILPPDSSNTLSKLHKDYLRRRNFHPNRIIRKYDLRGCNATGRYKFRLIIPIYQTRRLVSFISRAIFDEMTPKYLNPTSREVEISPKQTVYNLDNLTSGHDAIIVEGATDVWRWGDGAIALFGIQYTQRQIVSIVEKKIRKAFVMFDEGKTAQKRAEEICRFIYPFCESVEQIEPIVQDDLAKFTPKQVLEVKRMLGFK